jgi:cytochrome c oxidase subunit II
MIALVSLLWGGWVKGPQSTFQPEGPVARAQQDVFYVTVWVSLVIFVLVGAVLAYATWKYRARNADDEHAEPPPQGHGNPLVELSLIGASVLALVIIAVPTLRAIWYSYDVPESERANAYEVVATGYQWWFRFDYPAEQIEGGRRSDHGQRTRDPGGPTGAHQSAHGGCHPFVLGAEAGGQGRHDPQPRQPPLAAGG